MDSGKDRNQSSIHLFAVRSVVFAFGSDLAKYSKYEAAQKNVLSIFCDRII